MPQRIRLARSAGWRKPADAVVVARPSRWGNPFPVARVGRERSVELFAAVLRDDLTAIPGLDGAPELIATAERWRARLGGDPAAVAKRELAGRDLACWCPLDAPCHADLLLVLANDP